MSDPQTPQNPAGWYHAQGDPPETKRYWDGSQWVGEPQVTGVAAPLGAPGSAPVANLASAGKRIGARLLDNLLLLAILFAVSAAFLLPSMDLDAIFSAIEDGRELPEEALPSTSAALGATAIGALLPFLWELIWHGMAGGTPAKLLFGMRIRRVEDPLGDLGWGAAAKRSLIRLGGLLGAIPLVGLLSYLGWLIITIVSLVFLSSDKNRQTVMDKLASTIVVNK